MADLIVTECLNPTALLNANIALKARVVELESISTWMETREPYAWWLIGGTDVFLASEFTPDTEHRDEWCPLYR